MRDVGVRTWGNSADGSTVLVTGTYQLRSETSARLLSALPPLVLVAAADLRSPLVSYVADEIAREEPGQEAVLDRLLDLLLIAVLRRGSRAPRWPGGSPNSSASRP